MRILLGAHTIDPTLGGEAGIGWGWAEALARHPRITRVQVVAHPIARAAIQASLESDDELAAKLSFCWALPSHVDPWKGDRPGKKDWHRLLLHHVLWQRAAAEVAAQFAREIDVAHHVTPGTIHFRSFVRTLDVPYVIGPVGGGHAASLGDAARLWASSRDVHSGVEFARSSSMFWLTRRPALRTYVSEARSVLCANVQTLQLARRYTADAELMIDGGIDLEIRRWAQPPAGSPTILWVGKLEARKNPLAALDVMAALLEKRQDARLVLVGDGWLRERVRDEIARRGLRHAVDLLGQVPRADVEALYGAASIFLFTSLRDTFGVQNLEAMSHGLPIVFRDTAGIGVAAFAGDGAVGVPASANWAQQAAAAIGHLLDDEAAWRARSNAAVDAARACTWEAKAARAVAIYENAVAARAIGRSTQSPVPGRGDRNAAGHPTRGSNS